MVRTLEHEQYHGLNLCEAWGLGIRILHQSVIGRVGVQAILWKKGSCELFAVSSYNRYH